jgi:ABC-type transport system substrate-binding protein
MRAGGRARRIAGAAILVASALAACRGGSDEPARTTTSTTARASSGPVDGGIVRLGLAGELHADPVTASLGSPSDLLVLDLLHDGLTRLDEAGAPQPAVAARWSPDAALTTWTFTLDPKATFASGRAVAAADVIASLERVAKGGDASLAALRLEAITGFRAFVDGQAEHLAGLSAPDPATVQVHLDAPLALLPVILSSPVFGIVDVASLGQATAAGGDLAQLDLDGSWKLASVKGRTIRLTRRDGAGGHLDGVELRRYDDAEDAYDAFDAGKVDWALVPTDRYGDAVDAHGDDAFTPFHAELFFGLRLTSPNLAATGMRQAIAAAIDRAAIVRAVYPDLAQPLSTVVPDGVPGRSADPCPDCGHDADRARSLLAAAFPGGQVPTVAIDFDQSPAQEAMAKIVASDLQAVGIPTQLRPKPLEEYKRFVVSGGQELFSFGWIGGYGSPDAYLAPLFGSAANDNLTGLAAPAVDLELAAARAATDPAVARQHWLSVESLVLSQAVVVPIAQFRTQAVVADRVHGFHAAVDATVDWSQVWVSDGS